MHPLLYLLLLSFTLSQTLSSPTELELLMEIKASLDPQNRLLTSWETNKDPCSGSFEGVACNELGHVANISLQGKGLRGQIPAALGGLKSLTGLYLHFNALNGVIPKEIAELSELSDLYLNVNNLSGEIPPQVGNMSNLQVLQLCYNKLTGSIPTQLGSLEKLSVLALQYNQLTGAIPASLGDLELLSRLDLSFNGLFGPIPVKLAKAPLLHTLDIRNNSLSGNIPPALKRLTRPLSRREQALYDLIAWDCPDDHTVLFKNPNQERPATSYKFDKVFDPSCSTLKVYEEGAKNVALSALTGINATIFAYGQTSSGKTYTMKGITEKAVTDIFEHIKNTPERVFVLKVSALEIYNENVIDLLNRESGHLRLLDDPERGIIVEKLVEEVVKDIHHLRHLIGICEAQRQVGETSLNDKSSRSHQIIRLTVESSLREKSGCVKSFLASLNLVDLAGSERASQTNADGARFKEGSHINRSLLTLTTVIRKLSGGKRSGHIPYRDSKLTRILQHSLGGNARTAIICTMSPALSHVEQTRNTLSFATSAKEVTNNAQINMVVSDKKLVKHLQKKVERLEAVLRSPEPSSASYLQSLLIEKNSQIEQMEREMKELKRQRDHAQSQLEQERIARKEQKGTNQCGPSGQVARCLSFPVESGQVIGSKPTEAQQRNVVGRQAMVRQSVTSTDPSMLVQEIRKLEQRQRQLGVEANRALEILHKEVTSHRLGNQATAETIANMLSDIKEMQVVSTFAGEIVNGEKANAASLKEEITRLNSHECTIVSLERKLDNVQKSIDMLVSSFSSTEETPNSKVQLKKKIFPFALNNSSSMQNIIRSPCSPLTSSGGVVENEIENRVPENSNALFCSNALARPSEATPLKSGKNGNSTPSREVTPASGSNSVNVKKMQRMFKNAAEENIRSIRAYVTELKERVAKLQYQKQLLVCQVLELEANEEATTETENMDQSPMPWHLVFDDQRKQIIMLWHLCHVSIIHRTQFYLLFRGEPGDQIYLEVELRRLTWLEQHLAELGNASPALLGDEPASSVSSSIKALRQEREYLAKRVNSKLTVDEREMLYVKWEIPQGGKQRRLQLVNKLWTDPLNMQHIKESAEIVAKLVGFCESGEHVSKEMFELNFANPCDKKTWMGWNLISSLLNL